MSISAAHVAEQKIVPVARPALDVEFVADLTRGAGMEGVLELRLLSIGPQAMSNGRAMRSAPPPWPVGMMTLIRRFG